jgi:hypothetical protein
MSTFFEKNQRFGTLDAVFLIALLGIVGTISQSVLSEVFADHRRVEARIKVESLAFRLASDSQVATDTSGDELLRTPASAASSIPILNTGQISTDPWGRPYAYEIKRKSTGQVAQVTVWSEGSPNDSRIQYVFKAP